MHVRVPEIDGKPGPVHVELARGQSLFTNNAAVLAERIGMGLHSRIAKSKKEDYPYYNTMIVVNQPWVDLPENPYSQPEIKPKGGEALWLASSLVFLFGNQKKAGINRLDATKNGRKVLYGIRTRISILKNHVNGLAYTDRRIIAVPQGFISDTKEAIEEYKKKYAGYWNQILGGAGDYEISESVVEEVDDDND